MRLLLLVSWLFAVPAASDPLPGPIAIANVQGDSVVIESGRLVDSGLWMMPTLLDARTHPLEVTLQDGSHLRLDENAVAGDYVLDDGRKLRVTRSSSAPPQYVVETAAERSIFFSIRSRSRVGVLILPDDGDDLSLDSAASHYAVKYGSYYPRCYTDVDSTIAYEYPVDWRRRATVAFKRGGTGRARVVWLAYGKTPGEPSPPIRVQGVWRWTSSPQPRMYAPPLPPTYDELVREGRIIGQGVVDLATGVFTPASRGAR